MCDNRDFVEIVTHEFNTLVEQIKNAGPLTAELQDAMQRSSHNIEQLQKRQGAQLIKVCKLEAGDLFTCDLGAHKGYLYRKCYNSYEKRGDGEYLEYAYCSEIMFLNQDGVWETTCRSQEPTNWNPYCNVKRVYITVVPL